LVIFVDPSVERALFTRCRPINASAVAGNIASNLEDELESVETNLRHSAEKCTYECHYRSHPHLPLQSKNLAIVQCNPLTAVSALQKNNAQRIQTFRERNEI
jgi:hypothetical protein